VTKARVLGIDKDTTKTREDRIIQLSPRALAVLKRQLSLYRDLKSRRLIEHNQTMAHRFETWTTPRSAGV
jgi:hypothetical protein